MIRKPVFNKILTLVTLCLMASGAVFAEEPGKPEPRQFEKELLKYVKTLSRDVTIYGNAWLSPDYSDGVMGEGFAFKSSAYNQKVGEIQLPGRLSDIFLGGWLVAPNYSEGASFYFFPQITNYNGATAINLVQTELKAGTKFLDLRPYNAGFVGGMSASFSPAARQELSALGCSQYYSGLTIAMSSSGLCKTFFLQFLNSNDIFAVAKISASGITPNMGFCKETDANRLRGKFVIYNIDVLNKDKTVLYGKGYNKTSDSSTDIERIKKYAGGPIENSDVYANWKLDDNSEPQYSDEFKNWAQTHQFGCGNYAEDKF